MPSNSDDGRDIQGVGSGGGSEEGVTEDHGSARVGMITNNGHDMSINRGGRDRIRREDGQGVSHVDDIGFVIGNKCDSEGRVLGKLHKTRATLVSGEASGGMAKDVSESGILGSGCVPQSTSTEEYIKSKGRSRSGNGSGHGERSLP